MSKDDRQVRIDDYLLGRNSDAGRREIDEEITRNSELANQVADTELAMAAIELAEDEALKARLQNLEKSISANASSSAVEAHSEAKVIGLPPRANRRYLYGIAAAVLLLLVAGWFLMQPKAYDSPAALAMDTFAPYDNIVTGAVRGADASPSDAAYDAYDAGNFVDAAKGFAKLPATATTKFYLGQSLLGSQRFTEAADQFEDVRKAADFALAPEANYYLALARAGEGKTNVAKEILADIQRDADHPMLEQAGILMKKLLP
jgi:TolA-binding protein